MTAQKIRSIRASLLILTIFVISLLHYLTPVQYHHWHAVYQRLYYIPVIIGAWKLGVWPGILFAVTAAVMYLPHILIQWGHHQHEVFTQLIEVAMILVIGGVTGILSDRERREHEASRRAEKQVAHMDRLALLGQLAAGLAHEIRNPLGSLIGSAEILEKEVPQTSKAAPFVPIIKKELTRIKEKLNTFLSFAKPTHPSAIPNDINALVTSTISLVEKEAILNKVTLTSRLDSSLPLFAMDSELLRQVLLNLILNGIQAMDSGGVLTIATFGSDKEFGFIISDEGPGIHEDAKEHLFEPFFTTKSEGTGLGLAIVHQLVTAMNGTISLLPSETGAVFEVRIAL